MKTKVCVGEAGTKIKKKYYCKMINQKCNNKKMLTGYHFLLFRAQLKTKHKYVHSN